MPLQDAPRATTGTADVRHLPASARARTARPARARHEPEAARGRPATASRPAGQHPASRAARQSPPAASRAARQDPASGAARQHPASGAARQHPPAASRAAGRCRHRRGGRGLVRRPAGTSLPSRPPAPRPTTGPTRPGTARRLGSRSRRDPSTVSRRAAGVCAGSACSDHPRARKPRSTCRAWPEPSSTARANIRARVRRNRERSATFDRRDQRHVETIRSRSAAWGSLHRVTPVPFRP